MTPMQIAAECERLFQCGGPRVYYFEPARTRFLAFEGSAKRALHFAASGDQVWQRRAFGFNTPGGRRYVFMHVGTGV